MKSARHILRILLFFSALVFLVFTTGCGGYGSGGNGGGGSQTPPVPSGLAASAANAQVNLTWNASSGATGYYV
jgi:hypothetical protein